MRLSLISIILLFLYQVHSAQVIHIGLFQDQLVSSVVLSCTSGRYNIEVEGEVIGSMEEGDILFVRLENGLLHVYDAENDFGQFPGITLNYIALNSSFRIRPIMPVIDARTYDDNLILKADDRFMSIVNKIDFDKYLAGVVEAEAGPNAEKEFYKAQSVLCRTYAMKYLDKHYTEGFSLCDGVHCQAYKGKSVFNPEILEAVEETTGQILVDGNHNLITPVFHSNSGGQTQRASDVWISEEPYLQSVIDPFSLHQPNAKWKDTISFKDWKKYLIDNGMKSVLKIPDEIIYIEQMRRKKYFILDKDSLLMTKIREDWGFRSSFFDMFPEGDSIVIWGKGYGHGIGMSQEGAMKMARDGYFYSDILQFYYFDVRITSFRDLPAYSIPEVEF